MAKWSSEIKVLAGRGGRGDPTDQLWPQTSEHRRCH